jgi:hypothetical protein
MRRVIGMDIHRTFAEVVFWEDGKLRPGGRVSMTRAGLEGFGRSVGKEDEVVIEATGNAMAVVRVLSPYVARVIVANPLQVKAIAHATSRPTRSMPACWRRCERLIICPRSGCPTPIPSACGGWCRAVTRLSGTARRSRTRCMRSCTPTSSPPVRMPICSAVSAELGLRGRSCPMMSVGRSNGASA